MQLFYKLSVFSLIPCISVNSQINNNNNTIVQKNDNMGTIGTARFLPFCISKGILISVEFKTLLEC